MSSRWSPGRTRIKVLIDATRRSGFGLKRDSISLTSSRRHFLWQLDGKVATITLNRPERKNPLTFESYAELRDTFRDLVYADAVKAVVIDRRRREFLLGRRRARDHRPARGDAAQG